MPVNAPPSGKQVRLGHRHRAGRRQTGQQAGRADRAMFQARPSATVWPRSGDDLQGIQGMFQHRQIGNVEGKLESGAVGGRRRSQDVLAGRLGIAGAFVQGDLHGPQAQGRPAGSGLQPLFREIRQGAEPGQHGQARHQDAVGFEAPPGPQVAKPVGPTGVLQRGDTQGQILPAGQTQPLGDVLERQGRNPRRHLVLVGQDHAVGVDHPAEAAAIDGLAVEDAALPRFFDQHQRTVANRRIQVVAVRQAACARRGSIPAGGPQPGITNGGDSAPAQQVLEAGNAGHRRAIDMPQSRRMSQRMAMGVVEPGNHQPAAAIDEAGVGTDQTGQRRTVADEGDLPAGDGNQFALRPTAGGRQALQIDQDQIRRAVSHPSIRR